MDNNERIKMVKAMEYVARQINDEHILIEWLVNGVADGDIEYGDLSIDVNCDVYIDDDTFSDLMDTFLYCMERARRFGGLYCDGIATWPDN